MKRFNLFIAFAAFAFASCTSTDSKTEAVNTESTTEEVATASSALIPDGNYIVTNIATVVTWVAKKAVGDGHTGIIPVSNGKFKVKNGQISDGSIIFDMTDLQLQILKVSLKQILTNILNLWTS